MAKRKKRAATSRSSRKKRTPQKRRTTAKRRPSGKSRTVRAPVAQQETTPEETQSGLPPTQDTFATDEAQ